MADEAFDEVTFRHLIGCGIATGWRCWAVHAGGPAVPAWMARQVGPTGDVLATSPDVSWAGDAPAGWRVLAHDVRLDEPPEGDFDLVHARSLLARSPDRGAALDRIIRALRPGGVLVVEELDHLLVASCSTDRNDEARRATRIREELVDLLASRGVDLSCGRKLPRLLRERELRDVAADGSFVVAGPAARAAEAAQVRDVAEALATRGDVAVADLDGHLDAVTSGRLDVTSAALVGAWGRKPLEPSYVYASGARRAELERLQRLEAIADPATLATFDRLGVSAGWRCLEVGAGAGSIARALAARVGRNGHVVATDIDLEFLLPHTAPNLEVRRADVLVDELERARYDLVHARHLVAHVAARADDVIERLVRAVAPGGWLVVEDVDLATPMLVGADAAAQAAFDEVFTGFEDVLRSRGGDAHIGRRLPALFDAAGLVEVEVAANVAYSRGGDDATVMMLRSLSAVRPALIGAGVAPESVDVVANLLGRADHRAFGPINVAVTARRPTGAPT